MAHEIENGQIAWRGEMPWHGIGAEMKADASVDEWLAAANLDWTVDGQPIAAQMPDGSQVIVPDKLAFIRSHDRKVMTVASDSWKPLQNREAIQFMQDYVKAGGAELETVGALNDGKVVWGLARLNHDFEVSRGDKVRGYLMITTPHVVGKAIKVETTSVRVVCANTMKLAQGSSEVNYKQNHLSEFNVEAAKEAVALAHEGLAEAERRARILNKLKISAEDACRKVIAPVFEPHMVASPQAREWLDKMLAGEETMPLRLRQLMQAVEDAPGAIPNNGWGVMNAVTHWTDHRSGHTQQSRLNRAWGGDYATKKLEVEQRLLDLAS